jgi:RNA polymerase sigma-70 factor (ECF subfamily)
MVAEDIVNDCFITFWENREKIDLAQNIPGYILTSIKNRCLNHLRDQSTRLKAQRDIHSSALRLMAQQIATLETNDPESLFAGEIALIIENELKMMPEGTRSIFLAARFDDMTYKQVAEKFGLSVNQVSFEIRKASKILQEAFKDYTATILMLYKTIDISL